MSLREVFREGLSIDQERSRLAIVLEQLNKDPKALKPIREMGLRGIFEACVGKAITTSDLMNCQPSAVNRLLQEAVSGPRLSAFTNITGKIVIDGAIEEFQRTTNITDRLFETVRETDDGGRWAGLTDIADDVMEVPEGHEYPNTDFSEKYEDTPYSVKRGLKIGLTREMVHFDKTGLLENRARQVGERAGLNKETRCLRTFLGIYNPWKPMGVETATYGSVSARNNLLTGQELVDWTQIEAALLRFSDYKDDNGEPIEVMPTQIFVMPAKMMTANRILTATEIREVTDTNTTTLSANPLSSMNLELISSIRAYQLLQSTTVDPFTGTTYNGIAADAAQKVWFIGDFRRVFKYREIFPLSVDSVGAEHPAYFDRDILAQFKVGERGTPFVTSVHRAMKVLS